MLCGCYLFAFVCFVLWAWVFACLLRWCCHLYLFVAGLLFVVGYCWGCLGFAVLLWFVGLNFDTGWLRVVGVWFVWRLVLICTLIVCYC